MTKIYLYGALAKEFGESFCISIARPKDVLSAIDANIEGFQKRIMDLSMKGCHYSIIADDKVVDSPESFLTKRKINELHIVPAICGSGYVYAVISTIVGYLGFSEIVAYVITAVAYAAIAYGVQSLLAKPPDALNPSLNAATSATSKSFLFTNKENITQQGGPVPLAYGRLRIGSSVIQQTTKSYPNSISTFDEFVSQSASQEGQSFMAVIDNQDN